MKPEERIYNKIVEILRRSKPVMINQEVVENEIIYRISHSGKNLARDYDLKWKVFGWVYIGWVRRSLIAASLLLAVIFTYQQYIILNQVRKLKRQTVVTTDDRKSFTKEDISKKMRIFRLINRLHYGDEIQLSANHLQKLIDSDDELLSDYRILLRIIEDNPDLQKYIEGRLSEYKNEKTDI